MINKEFKDGGGAGGGGGGGGGQVHITSGWLLKTKSQSIASHSFKLRKKYNKEMLNKQMFNFIWSQLVILNFRN